MWILCSHGEGLGERIQDQFVFHLVNWGWSHHNIFKMWGVKDIAREEGGLVDPGTIFFTPENPE